jgi:hypothetical protein
MAADEQHSDGLSELVERQSVIREPCPSPNLQERVHTHLRRPSSAIRRTARNIESFNRNRDHHQRIHDDTSVFLSHRARTRSLARIQAEQRPRQSLQQELGHREGKHEENQEARQEGSQEQQITPSSQLAQGTSLQNNISAKAEPLSREWRPSIALGSPLWLDGEDLSAIEIADRKVAQTRLWVDYYQGVPDFVRTHQEAVREREQLDVTDEANTKPRSALTCTHSTAIQQRLRHLRVILQDSHFPPERANIEAAIAGYESGAIPYSDSYTLIWAGRIVDRCPDFDSFTADRGARLDRYEAEYGPSWLWYEPPLSRGGGTLRGPTIVTKRAICLENKPEWRRGTDNMGHYRVQMSFRRRKENVSRSGPVAVPFSPLRTRPPNTTTTRTKPRRRSTAKSTAVIPQPNTSLPGTTVPDRDGPRIVWDTLLDTGATLPCLYEGDLPRLGINRYAYAAQSSRTIATADSVIETRVYELDVGVCGGDGGEELLGLGGVGGGGGNSGGGNSTPLSPCLSPRSTTLHPNEKSHDPKQESESLTCTVPVVFFGGSSSDFSGDHTPDRLSGILPFHLCYLSSAPGNFKLWMGETKGDVIGPGRLPGLMRYGGVIGGVRDMEKRHPPPTKTTRSKLVVRRGSRNPETPEKAIFARGSPQRAGWVEQDEDVEDRSPMVSGFEFDNVTLAAEGFDPLRAKRKREAGRHNAQRRESEEKPAKKRSREGELTAEERVGK